MKKRILTLAAAALLPMLAMGQGANTGLGGYDGDYHSLYERLSKLENKNDQFNLYLNFASSYQLGDESGDFRSAFRAKQLRLEIKGQIGEHLGYRLRHRLNKSNQAMSEENFAKATDVMMVSWKFNERWTLMGGKLCQFWGGFEFDENPMYIYEYSEMVNHLDNFLAGAAVAWYPLKGQEFVLNVSNSYSGRFADEYGVAPMTASGKAIEASRHPLTYIANWNGSLFGGLIETRWGAGVYNQARSYMDKMLFLGQKLCLPKFQFYLDYMGAWEGLDRLRIASEELGGYQTDVCYQSLVGKLNWQFRPGFNLMAKGMYETASVKDFHNYRTALGYVASLEYYPLADQDFRVFLAYIGRDYQYTQAPNRHTNRVELGFMYRIKAY